MKNYPDAIRAGGVLILSPECITSVERERPEDRSHDPRTRLIIIYTNSVDRSERAILFDEQAEQWWSDFLARLDIEDDPELLEVVL